MQALYRHRRQTLLDKIGHGTVVIRSAPLAVMHHDVEYNFRQDSDFFYLTGLDEPESVALLVGNHEAHQFVLFVRPKNPILETWTGYRVGVELAKERFGADAVYSIEELDEHLPQYLACADRIYYHLGRDRSFNETLLRHWQTLLAGYQRSGTGPLALEDYGPLLHGQRLIKDDHELSQIRTAVEIAVEAHNLAQALTQPGRYEYEIQAEMEKVFRAQGAMGPAYPSIVAAGANACILHYTSNNTQMQEGDLLLVDAGASYGYYNSDITRTFAVGQSMSREQQALYELVLAAQRAAIAQVQPGHRFNQPHDQAVRVLTEGLVDLGLLVGEVETLIEEEAYKPFYMHRTSHWLGLDVHDVGAYKEASGEWRLLQAGQLLTIEPGLYVSPTIELMEGQPPVPPDWRGIGIRIEDDVLVTAEGCEVLTAGVPK
ncbi:aminopeptidase P N-terminal domain-containing protein [Lyngbya confervoides]|uniref:Xaa-Pro aminopeptidase n=1 Tax=Lyngbya confervoides BDU141951 TaxID=1574623 RepID=A0ABD4SZE2_9CYAN|nr:aminopeptidase P N-terminal domain-containing protein [Lyngbya confervoides]MCM1981475.1 aminopeptidase P N-terminal domain-containing protein [Lyngbya confervoides BDU141951]